MKWYQSIKKNNCVFIGCDFVRISIREEKCTKCKRKRLIQEDY